MVERKGKVRKDMKKNRREKRKAVEKTKIQEKLLKERKSLFLRLLQRK